MYFSKQNKDMNLKNIILICISASLLLSCADYKGAASVKKKEKNYYSSRGFALIYEDNLYMEKIINKKINNDKVIVMHSFLKPNTYVKIINPDNLKIIETKVYKKAIYPDLFSVVLSKKAASILELDLNSPYVEVVETKKNKKFIAKKANIFDEEKNVVGKAPVDEIKMDDLNVTNDKKEEVLLKTENFTIVINDFYYEDSANTLKKELYKKTKIDNIYIRKINNKKYRLLAGPFKNFNALKSTYISLNNLGFENLNIYKD